MAQLKHLAARSDLLRQTRSFFDARDFLEVQPPCLCRDCVVDAYLDPICVETKELRIGTGTLPERFFLQTSPESAMKRMLSAGAPSIYSLGPVFRSGEIGDHHNVEFTMLEWYEVGGDYQSAIELAAAYVGAMLQQPHYDVISYRRAFLESVGLDPIDCRLDALAGKAHDIDSQLTRHLRDDRDALLNLLLDHHVIPGLGQSHPCVLTDYPLSQAALAKPSPSDPDCASRFELFFRGVELANGYDELLDPQELRRRSELNNRERIRSGRAPLKIETTLMDAMENGLPACSGVALGFDRLLMLRVGGTTLHDVLPFPTESA